VAEAGHEVIVTPVTNVTTLILKAPRTMVRCVRARRCG
jgi:hypothetical protein